MLKNNGNGAGGEFSLFAFPHSPLWPAVHSHKPKKTDTQDRLPSVEKY